MALLCLRLAASALMANELISSTVALPLVLLLALGATALAIGSGLWTPAFSTSAAALRLWVPLPAAYCDWPHRTLDITVFLALAILGPGAYSMDCLLFGRRRVIVQQLARSAS